MKPGATSDSPRGARHSQSKDAPKHRGHRRAALTFAAAIVAVAATLIERGSHRRATDEVTAPDRQVDHQGARPPGQRVTDPRPALPQARPAEPATKEPRLVGLGAAEAGRALTDTKVQKYVYEAYPAWRRAHPGQECPRQLIELNAYMEDKNANDAWGRPLRMFCGAARWAGKKQIEVISLGRDAEAGTEDDISAEQ